MESWKVLIIFNNCSALIYLFPHSQITHSITYVKDANELMKRLYAAYHDLYTSED